MINDPLQYEAGIVQEKESIRRKLLAGVCAIVLTGMLLMGYGYFRARHAQQVLANNAQPPSTDTAKGPPLAHIVIDEPLLEKGMTTLRGSVKNISKHELTGLSIAMELRRRQDGATEEAVLVPVVPAQLQPDEEGVYSIKLIAQDYGSIRLVGLKAGPQATLISYSTTPGKKRPPERLVPKTVIVKRAGRPGEFLNTPDNPGRIR